MAFNSATHDIAADGFYIASLNSHEQTWFVGIRNTFYRLSMMAGQGLLVMLAGYIQESSGLPSKYLKIEAVPVAVHSLPFAAQLPDKWEPGQTNPELLISNTSVQIPLLTVSETSFKTLAESVVKWNKLASEGVTADIKSLSISPENLITASGAKKGYPGIIFYRLSEKPEPKKKLTVNVSRSSGEKRISIVSGDYFVFDDKNWDKPVALLYQTLPSLKIQADCDLVFRTGNIHLAWGLCLAAVSVLFFLFSIYHLFVLPAKEATVAAESLFSGATESFRQFFGKEGILAGILFLLLYRLGESQLLKLASPFMLDSQDAGGLGLRTVDVGFIYGTIGVIFLTAGGLIGGWLAAWKGLKYWLLLMTIAINLPDLVYVYMSYFQPQNLWIIASCVAVEQLGYGFGFTAYMLYMVYLADSSGRYKTSHYAFMTAFMALGMMLPGMLSGYIQEWMGYKTFFLWVNLCTIPGFIMLLFIKVSPDFGLRKKD